MNVRCLFIWQYRFSLCWRGSAGRGSGARYSERAADHCRSGVPRDWSPAIQLSGRINLARGRNRRSNNRGKGDTGAGGVTLPANATLDQVAQQDYVQTAAAAAGVTPAALAATCLGGE